MTMKRMSLVMDHSRCLSWLSGRLRNVSIIAVIQADISSGVLASASPISSSAINSRPLIGGLFRCDEFRSICAIAAPLLGGSGDGGLALLSLAIIARSESSGRTLLMSMSIIAEVFIRTPLLQRSLVSVSFDANRKTVIVAFFPCAFFACIRKMTANYSVQQSIQVASANIIFEKSLRINSILSNIHKR